MAVNVGIYVYEQAEVLDFAGPFEVFSTASRVDGAAPFAALLVGESGAPVSARGGFRVSPACGFHDHPPLDVLIVPGGEHAAEMDKPRVCEWIARASRQARLTASVCTGVFLLAQAGVLGDERVTTHRDDIPELRRRFPRLTVVEAVRWVDEGAVVTSAGISAGIDMSLHLVERLGGRGLAERTARQMEFDWTPG